MATITTILNKVKSLDAGRIAVDALSETSEKRIEANREQMSKGLDNTGGIIGVYASRQYAAFKQALGSQAPYGIVDLKLTKSFQQQIKSSVNGNTIVTDSTDSKSADLQKRYGTDVFGLSTQYKITYIANDLRPAFNQKIENALGLKFSG